MIRIFLLLSTFLATAVILTAGMDRSGGAGDTFVRSLAVVEASSADLTGSFRLDPDEASPIPHRFDDGIAKFISMPEGHGALTTAWFDFDGEAITLVGGFPRRGGMSLVAEIQRRDRTVRTVAYQSQDPAGAWRPWRLTAAPDDERIRFLAQDEVDGPEGWLGVSAPYPFQPWLTAARLASVFFVAFMLLIGTGIGVRHAAGRRGLKMNFAWGFLPGVAALALLGALTWIRPANVSAHTIALATLLPWLWGLVFYEFKSGWFSTLVPEEKTIVLITFLVAVAAAGRGFFSIGPHKELYDGLVSRSTEVGYTSDSRISFHNVQVTLHGWAVDDPRTNALFDPFFFTTRGPLAGWVVSPVVALFDPHVPVGAPDQVWEPFDPYGFASFRMTMTILSSLLVLIAYGTVSQFASRGVAVFATIALATTPFFIHELFFTWPKLACTSCVLLAFLAAAQRRALVAGFMMGVSYLFHPMAMLLMPIPLLWRATIAVSDARRDFRATVRALCRIGIVYVAGIAIVCLPWVLANRHVYHQGSFFTYILAKDSCSSWVISRLQSLANTLIPFYQYAIWPSDPRMSTPGTKSPEVVLWSWQYWSTVPFGLGLTFFPLIYMHFRTMYLRHRTAAWLLVLVPFIVHWLCFGWEVNGLTRNSGHPVFCALVLLVTWAIATSRGSVTQSRWMRALLSLRVFELVFFLFGVSYLSSRTRLNKAYWENDVFVIVVSAAALAMLGVLWRREFLARLRDPSRDVCKT